MTRDHDWALEQLSAYAALADAYMASSGDREVRETLVKREHSISRLVADLLPGTGWPVLNTRSFRAVLSDQRLIVGRAAGAATDAAEFERHWPLQEEVTIDPGMLHSWVRDAARGLWSSGHYGEAVSAAAKVLNAKMQERVGRTDIGETELVNQALSDDPPKLGNARLQVAGFDASPTSRSRQSGARSLGQAIFLYWRNPEAHVVTGLGPEEATEALAAMSAFARFLQRSTLLETAVGPDSVSG